MIQQATSSPNDDMIFWLSSNFCFANGDCPYIAAALTRLNRPIFVHSVLTCIASSRVGTMISACGLFSSHSICSAMGIANAAVFPLPVCDLATISSPVKATGITAFERVLLLYILVH